MHRSTLRPLLAGLLVLGLAACGTSTSTSADTRQQTVGVALPTTQYPRWVMEGDTLELQLETLGYSVERSYAENDVSIQQQQIDQMIDNQVQLLIIGSIDGTALTEQLDHAEAAGIPVISYDRLLQNHEGVDYYTSFDNARVGQQQATSLLQNLGVIDAAGTPLKDVGPFNIELFAGSPDDNNAHVFYDGAMAVLQPYLDNGTLIVASGEYKFEEIAIKNWEGELGGQRMEKILTMHSKTINGILSPYDGISVSAIEKLKEAGYGTASKRLPVITGQDAELPGVKAILAGEQTSTIFKDTRQLAEATVLLGHTILQGRTPETNDHTTYNNGAKVVPALLLPPALITAQNAIEALVDSGYYAAEDVN